MKNMTKKQKKVTIQSVPSLGKYHRCGFEKTILLKNNLYNSEEIVLITKLISLLHQIEQLKLEKLKLKIFNSSSPEEIIENQQKVEKKDEINRKLKIERLKNFRKRAKKNVLILDSYIDSEVFPIQRIEGEWVYSQKKTEFDHTKTFGRIEVARHMIELASDAIEMCSIMKNCLLERQLNSWASDIGEDICEIQKKLLIMQEAFLFSTLPISGLTNFESIKIDLELSEVPKQFIFEDCIFRNGIESASSKNAVASSYFFQCLEQELRAQLYSFIKAIDNWRRLKESRSLRRHLRNQLVIHGFVPEFEVKTYNAEGEKNITTTNLLLLEMLGNEGELFRQEQRARELLRNNHELPYYFLSHTRPILCEETRIPVFDWSFSGRCEREWKQKIKNFEQERNLLVQEVKGLTHQLEEKRRSEETKKLSESSTIITDEALLQTNITSEKKEDHFEENESQQQLTATLELEVTKETTKKIIEVKNETSESPNLPEDKATAKVVKETKKNNNELLVNTENNYYQTPSEFEDYNSPKQELDRMSEKSSVLSKKQTNAYLVSIIILFFFIVTIIFISVNIKKFFKEHS